MSEVKDQSESIIEFRVRYYETDAMGIVHHSNYLRWFEMGRTDYLRKAGLPYRSLEERGIKSPVIGVRASYRKPARYDDVIQLKTWVKAYNGVRLTMAYAVMLSGKTICTGESDHAFMSGEKTVAPARSIADVHQILESCLKADEMMLP